MARGAGARAIVINRRGLKIAQPSHIEGARPTRGEANQCGEMACATIASDDAASTPAQRKKKKKRKAGEEEG